MAGDECPEGTLADQSTLLLALKSSGNWQFSATPEPPGPRNCGQFSWPHAVTARTAPANAPKIVRFMKPSTKPEPGGDVNRMSPRGQGVLVKPGAGLVRIVRKLYSAARWRLIYGH